MSLGIRSSLQMRISYKAWKDQWSQYEFSINYLEREEEMKDEIIWSITTLNCHIFSEWLKVILSFIPQGRKLKNNNELHPLLLR